MHRTDHTQTQSGCENIGKILSQRALQCLVGQWAVPSKRKGPGSGKLVAKILSQVGYLLAITGVLLADPNLRK